MAAIVAALGAVPFVYAAPEPQPPVQVNAGVVRQFWNDPAIPARIHLLRIDLTMKGIALYATPPGKKGRTTTSYAASVQAEVAINGDAFAALDFKPRGLAYGEGEAWVGTADSASTTLFHFRRVGERTFAFIEPPDDVKTAQTLVAGTQGAIGGGPLLVSAGAAVLDFDCDDPVAMPCIRAPRTAIGVSKDGTELMLVVVNGWQTNSKGMLASELAAFMRDRGAYTAMALDGGSSTTLAINGGVFNSPSDGIERSVANHLAVKYDNLPVGTLRGLVCKTSNFTACDQDPSLQIGDARIQLDDGRVDMTPVTPAATAKAEFIFDDVTPRLACVKVSKDGYKTVTACKQVQSSIQNYSSVVLEPGMDPPPDAGVPDAGEIPTDAAVDDGMRPDAGNPNTGDGGGCCDAGTDLPRGQLLLVGLVAWMLVRRRGTNRAG